MLLSECIFVNADSENKIFVKKNFSSSGKI